jgi:hypothetical protein
VAFHRFIEGCRGSLHKKVLVDSRDVRGSEPVAPMPFVIPA